MSSDEINWSALLKTVKLESQWINLPEHLLEAIFHLIKDGKDSSDWSIVQVTSLVCLVSVCQTRDAQLALDPFLFLHGPGKCLKFESAEQYAAFFGVMPCATLLNV